MISPKKDPNLVTRISVWNWSRSEKQSSCLFCSNLNCYHQSLIRTVHGTSFVSRNKP